MTLFGKTNGMFEEGCVIDFSWPKICLLDPLKKKNSDNDETACV